MSGLVYPHPLGTPSKRPPASDLHETAGLPGNWALDFMAPGGTRVLVVQAGVISKLSGHDPQLGEIAPGIFGWNVYLTIPGVGVYFMTHLGNRHVHVGQHLTPGAIIGHVGHWPNDPGRSHTHLGYTSDNGEAAAKAHIVAVSEAPRVAGHWPA